MPQDLTAIEQAHGPLVKELVDRARTDNAGLDSSWDDPDYEVSDIQAYHYFEQYYDGVDHSMTNADYGYLLQSVGNRPTNTGNAAAPNVRTYTRLSLIHI